MELKGIFSGRIISIEQNEEAMDEAKKLDGCYVILIPWKSGWFQPLFS